MTRTRRQSLAFTTSILLLFSALALAQTETVLHSFAGGRDGGYPASRLILDPQGNLYGTTFGGRNTQAGYGTVFKVAPGGRETVLHNFTGGADGANPSGGLVRDGQGNFYGATQSGGSSTTFCSTIKGCGTIFEVSPTGVEQVLYTFPGGNGGDGFDPSGPLVRDAQGNLYGLTYGGGAYTCGTVFQLTPTGTETILYSFNCLSTGLGGFGGLIQDPQGNLYGASLEGGSFKCAFGCGLVFEVNATNQFSLLYGFSGLDGYAPVGDLIRDSDGNTYGTTIFGGSNPSCTDSLGCGTVFEIASDGTEKVLYSFSGLVDGANPHAGLVRDKQGNLYGTTYSGGEGSCSSSLGCGVVFELAPDGTQTVLHSFKGGTDGGNPQGGLALDARGNLYGTTYYYGAHGFGTVFKIAP